MADRLPFSGEQYWNAVSRNAFPGAKLFTYTSQSRTTLKATFTDAGAGTPHTNPVIADANGLFAAIYGNGEYFIDIRDTTEATLIYQEDEVFGTTPGNTNETTTVSLIADLRLVDTTAFQSAFVEGTTAIDDGGQGRFFFDSGSSAIDNGTTIIAPTVGTGRWLILRTGTDSISTSNIVNLNVTTAKIAAEAVTFAKLSWMPLNSRSGYVITNGTDTAHDLDISVGRIVDDTQAVIINLTSALTKQIDANFAVGDNVGGLSDQDTLSVDSEYFPFAISKADGTTDVIIATTSANALADTVATAALFIFARKLEPVLTDGSSNIINTNNTSGYVKMFDTPILDFSGSASTSGANVTVTQPTDVTGIFGLEYTNGGSVQRFYVNSVNQPNAAVSSSLYDISLQNDNSFTLHGNVIKQIEVNSSSQVRQRASSALAGKVLSLGFFNRFRGGLNVRTQNR